MKLELFAIGVPQLILTRMQSFANAPADKVSILEIQCGNGLLAHFLKENGYKKYHGTDTSAENIEAAKATNQGYNKRFQVGAVSEVKGFDVVICSDGWEKLPSGQKTIMVTSGYPSWDNACTHLSPLFNEGAQTIQFEQGYYLTFGTIR